ncbi:MAG TPA: metal-dependent hydrolase [Opitutaceae bacterium]|nr:metal-dependent hydrolase [Opitutaceae bacterium]
MRITYFGHSAFLLEIAGTRLVIDPWLATNPHGAVPPEKVPCHYVLCTHAHGDHIADALPLARAHGATIVAPFELAEYFAAEGAKTIDLMPGGGVNLPWGRITMTPAIHSSALELEGGQNRAMGVASGYLISAESRTVYHAGDTALFGDMALIGRHAPDVAMIPIGDFYTMGPADAVEALNLIRPKVAIPMHYNTGEKTRQDPHAFAALAARAAHNVHVMSAGETFAV